MLKNARIGEMILSFGRVATIALIAVMPAACGGSPMPTNPSSAPLQNDTAPKMSREEESAGYKILYSFNALYTDRNPVGGVTAMDGELYGTTSGGDGLQALGTVFRVDPTTGVEKMLYEFQRAPDGDNSFAGLIAVDGKLDGTTVSGGTYEAGTVFSVTKTGKEKVLHSFSGGDDGATPFAPLIYVKGMLYGTTFGLANDGGTVFSITLDGQETVVHRFAGYPNGDGLWPWAPLISSKDALYGTTTAGGTVLYGKAHEGAGTVFSISPSGSERVIYSFNGKGDGADPMGGLVRVDGALYGTTTGAVGYNCGTVFRIDKNGNEKILHAFLQGSDGCSPQAELLNVNGVFYGTTSSGGAYGKGTVFSITRSGEEAIVHSFGYGTDGSGPQAGLTNLKGILYGTTYGGGTHGYGTVFALTP